MTSPWLATASRWWSIVAVPRVCWLVPLVHTLIAASASANPSAAASMSAAGTAHISAARSGR